MANADVATTTYAYDANGNLVQAGGWSYMWDYLNRMLASGYANSTTTYAYDPSGARVLQTSTTSTTYYPNKFYSLTSTKAGSNTYATSTNYIWNGDALLATIDQKLYNGTATGSPITRFIHPDHLGSTNAVTDQNGSLVQLMDYYPYGATRISTSTYPTDEKRQYIGQYSDTGTSLSYLNTRYYDSARGQFTSEDPVFLGIGNPNLLQQLANLDQPRLLTDPQQMNSYAYTHDNPILNKDPNGLWAVKLGIEGTIPGWGLTGGAGIAIDLNGIDYYVDSGMAAGGQIGSVQITTADLDHEYSITTSAFATGGDTIGVEVSKGMTYYPYSLKKPRPTQEASFGLRGGLGGGAVTETSGPIWKWSSAPQQVIYGLATPQVVSTLTASNGPPKPAQSAAGFSAGGGSPASASLSQTLNSLANALQQLSSILSAIANKK